MKLKKYKKLLQSKDGAVTTTNVVVIIALTVVLATIIIVALSTVLGNENSGAVGQFSNKANNLESSIMEAAGQESSSTEDDSGISTNNVVPEGCVYTSANGTVYNAGEIMPPAQIGDKFETSDYRYGYGTIYGDLTGVGEKWYIKEDLINFIEKDSGMSFEEFLQSEGMSEAEFCKEMGLFYDGWTLLKVKDDTKLYFQDIYSNINNVPVRNICGTFSRCENLVTAPILPDTITYIHAQSFYNCYKLTSIAIPKGITEIPEECFAYCEALMEIYIPKSLTYIDSGVFWGCSNGMDVYYEGTEDDWNKIVDGGAEWDNNYHLFKWANIHYNSY